MCLSLSSLVSGNSTMLLVLSILLALFLSLSLSRPIQSKTFPAASSIVLFKTITFAVFFPSIRSHFVCVLLAKSINISSLLPHTYAQCAHFRRTQSMDRMPEEYGRQYFLFGSKSAPFRPIQFCSNKNKFS